MKRTATSAPTVARAKAVDADPPYLRLRAQQAAPLLNPVARGALHWFREKDLRVFDNTALGRARRLARDAGTDSPCRALFVLDRAALRLHGAGTARNSFLIANVAVLRAELRGCGIELEIVASDSSGETCAAVLAAAQRHGVSHVFANFEYEYDELRRDLRAMRLLRGAGIDFVLAHDQTAVEPGTVLSRAKTPLKVFTPFWHEWVPMVNRYDGGQQQEQRELEREGEQVQQRERGLPAPKKAKTEVADGVGGADSADSADVVDSEVVAAAAAIAADLELDFDAGVLKRWPPGRDAALVRLRRFLAHKVHSYHRDRSAPALDCTSRLSPYLAVGAVSVREVLHITRAEALDGGNKKFGTNHTGSGVDAWVRELCFREFYRQTVACCAPHVVMNMPSSLAFAAVRTRDPSQSKADEEAWERWCAGRTGYPFVDAGMRQLLAEGYMHNRLRMNVSSFLRMNMLLDYRRGLTYFANKLVDWDACNNAYGWDMSYTVFNPVLQAEKNDPRGEYIRRWVPELRNVDGKAVFDPHGRLPAAEFAKLNYPAPQMPLNEAKERAMASYKRRT